MAGLFHCRSHTRQAHGQGEHVDVFTIGGNQQNVHGGTHHGLRPSKPHALSPLRRGYVDGVNQLDDAHQCIGLRVGRYLYYAGPASRNIRGQDNKVSSMTEETPVIILEDNLRAWQSIITGIYHGHG